MEQDQDAYGGKDEGTHSQVGMDMMLLMIGKDEPEKE